MTGLYMKYITMLKWVNIDSGHLICSGFYMKCNCSGFYMNLDLTHFHWYTQLPLTYARVIPKRHVCRLQNVKLEVAYKY